MSQGPLVSYPCLTLIRANIFVFLLDLRVDTLVMVQTTLEFVKTYASSFAALFGTPNTEFRDAPGSLSADSRQAGAIYLNPARRSGARLVLLPLLPPPKPKVDLPSELWRRCISYAMDLSSEKATASSQTFSRLLNSRRNLLLVSKLFKVRFSSRYRVTPRPNNPALTV